MKSLTPLLSLACFILFSNFSIEINMNTSPRNALKLLFLNPALYSVIQPLKFFF